MKEFTIYYEHSSYGFYTTIVEGESMIEALQWFIDNHVHKHVYGIMEKK